MRNNLLFELGLGVRCGESIALVDEETGESMFSIDEDFLLQKSTERLPFARYLGESIGAIFRNL